MLSTFVLSNAMADTINNLQAPEKLNNTEIVKIVKQNLDDVSKLDIVNHANEKDPNVEYVYNKFNNEIVKKYGDKQLKDIKKELNKAISDAKIFKGINIDFRFAIPKEVLKDIPNAQETDTSYAHNAVKSNEVCEVIVNLEVDNKGRLFEASENAHLTLDEISQMTTKEQMSVLKETVLHELSHCAIQKTNYKTNFSNEMVSKYPDLVKITQEKMKDVSDKINNNQVTKINALDKLMFINYQESFADVMSAFARMGDKPTTHSILEAKEQIKNLMHLRSSKEKDIFHLTMPAIQSAYVKMDMASKLSMQEREKLAQQIATESILPNMKKVIELAVNKDNIVGDLALFYVGGLDIKNKEIITEVPKDKESLYEKIAEQIQEMEDSKSAVFGLSNQKIYSYEDIVFKNMLDKNENLEISKSKNNYSFNILALNKARLNNTINNKLSI